MATALKIGFAIAFMLALVPLLVWGERRVSAWMQGRMGPNRVGPLGFLQPLADVVKLLFKEEIIPAGADRTLYLAAPLLVLVPPFLGFLVIPFGNRIGGEHLQVAHLGVGILFTMSVLSMAVYGLALGGWASNNKYSLMGGLRASAQLISYELTLGLTILMVLMFAGSVDPRAIVEKQAASILDWNLLGGSKADPWSWVLLPSGLLAFILFFVASLAENNRLPFDLPECEAELVGGYHTEYSGMKFGIFMMSEYVAMILMCSLMTTFFLGGWSLPPLTRAESGTLLQGVLSVVVFSTKVVALLFVYIWIRWTLPRFKYNQLMDLGWKRLLPVSLANLMFVAAVGALRGGTP